MINRRRAINWNHCLHLRLLCILNRRVQLLMQDLNRLQSLRPLKVRVWLPRHIRDLRHEKVQMLIVATLAFEIDFNAFLNKFELTCLLLDLCLDQRGVIWHTQPRVIFRSCILGWWSTFLLKWILFFFNFMDGSFRQCQCPHKRLFQTLHTVELVLLGALRWRCIFHCVLLTNKLAELGHMWMTQRLVLIPLTFFHAQLDCDRLVILCSGVKRYTFLYESAFLGWIHGVAHQWVAISHQVWWGVLFVKRLWIGGVWGGAGPLSFILGLEKDVFFSL